MICLYLFKLPDFGTQGPAGWCVCVCEGVASLDLGRTRWLIPWTNLQQQQHHHHFVTISKWCRPRVIFLHPSCQGMWGSGEYSSSTPRSLIIISKVIIQPLKILVALATAAFEWQHPYDVSRPFLCSLSNCLLVYVGLYSWWFTLGSKSEETPKTERSYGWHQPFGTKEYILELLGRGHYDCKLQNHQQSNIGFKLEETPKSSALTGRQQPLDPKSTH